MAQFKITIKSFADAMEFLGGKTDKKLAHNTYVRVSAWEGGRITRSDLPVIEVQVWYHRTAIATFSRDGTSEFTNGGHQTATTKQRLNELLPVGVSIYQKNFEWVLCRVEAVPPHATVETEWPPTLRLTGKACHRFANSIGRAKSVEHRWNY